MLKLPPDEVVRIRKMVPTIRELRIIDLMRDYSVYRNRYFNKRFIPPAEDVAFAFVPCRVMRNVLGEDCLGFNVSGPIKEIAASVIVIAIESNALQVSQTLLHEMAHIEVENKWNRSMGHGKYWQARMRRLAAQGAFENLW